MLDAAAFAATNRLGLNRWKADFVPVSFYKICGYQTGIGCLIARPKVKQRLKDGTLNYLSIPAVEQGLKLIDEIGIDTIHTRVTCLTGWLLQTPQELHHSSWYDSMDQRPQTCGVVRLL